MHIALYSYPLGWLAVCENIKLALHVIWSCRWGAIKTITERGSGKMKPQKGQDVVPCSGFQENVWIQQPSTSGKKRVTECLRCFFFGWKLEASSDLITGTSEIPIRPSQGALNEGHVKKGCRVTRTRWAGTHSILVHVGVLAWGWPPSILWTA